MKTTTTYRGKRAFWVVFLVYLFSLSCHVVFIHSHWREGHLVALHAHPYDLGPTPGATKKNDTHTEKEYELYELIFTSPLLELVFYEVTIVPFRHMAPAVSALFRKISTEQFLSNRSVRGPPVFVSFLFLP